MKRYENEFESEVFEKSFGHHRDSASVHSAAMVGCYVCSVLWHILSDIPLSSSEREFFEKEETRVRERTTTPHKDDIDQLSEEDFFTHVRLRRTTWHHDDERPDELTLDTHVGVEQTVGLGMFTLQRLSGKSTVSERRIQV